MSAAVAAAAAASAGVAFAVMMVMMIAPDIGIKSQIAGEKCFHRSVRIAGNTAEEPDSGGSQCHLSTAANAAADENICIQSGQYTGQSAVTAAGGIHNLGTDHFSICHIINLELTGMAEMLEDFAVFVSNRNSHNQTAPLLFYFVPVRILPQSGFFTEKSRTNRNAVTAITRCSTIRKIRPGSTSPVRYTRGRIMEEVVTGRPR